MNKEEKLVLVNKSVEKIGKDISKEAIRRFGDGPIEKPDVISTGSIKLNAALGIGGLAKGRIVEIYGPESSGKTTLATHLIAECQKAGGVAAIIDAEHAFDLQYAKNIGVNVNELYISQPDFGEQALRVADELINSGGMDLIIIDSVAALTPKAEIEGEIGDSKVGLQARMMSQACRMLTGPISKNKVLVVFINQIRLKIGVMYGSPETTTGGNALKFYASVRLDIRKKETNKDGDESVSNTVKVKVVKNKLSDPFTSAEFDIVFGEGIDKVGELIDVAKDLGIAKLGGSWITYKDIKVQGKDAFRRVLNDNPELFEILKSEVNGLLYKV